MDDEFDLEAQYNRLAATDPQFQEIRAKLAETILEEMPENLSDFESDHATFLRGYAAVKQAYFNKFDPDLVERSKRGDIDAAQQMLIKAGILDAMKEKNTNPGGLKDVRQVISAARDGAQGGGAGREDLR